MKLIEWSKYSSVLSKRVVGARQKNRRFSAKESSVLSKRSDDAKRKQSIYSQISFNCYAVEGSNTGPKHSKIIAFPFGFSWSFLLLPSCLCGFIWSNTVELGGFRKEVCFFDEIQYPYEDFCESLIRSWQGRGAFWYTPIAAMYGQILSRQSLLHFYWAEFLPGPCFCFYHLLQKEDVLCRYILFLLVAGAGIEPATSRLWAWRATTALPRDLNSGAKVQIFFERGSIMKKKIANKVLFG